MVSIDFGLCQYSRCCALTTISLICRCPSLRAIRFHGNKEERENLSEEYFTNEAAAHDGRRPEKQIKNEKGEWEDDNSENPRGKGDLSTFPLTWVLDLTNIILLAWDVCVTTYEVANTEKKALGRFAWKYLVIDEAHRLKNEASMFSTVSRADSSSASFVKYESALLTSFVTFLLVA